MKRLGEQMRVLVIIPAYNESATIQKVVADLLASTASTNIDCDYIVVNDGSMDRTEAVLSQSDLSHITLPVNMGIGAAVQTGYIYAFQNGYDAAVQMDGDGQHPPKFIPDLIAPLEKDEADFVIGSRFLSAGGFRSSALRRFGIRFLSGSIRLATGKRVYDVTSGFRAVNRKGIALFADRYAKDYPEPESIVHALKYGLRLVEVPVEMAPRETGQSSIGSMGSAYYMIKVTLAVLLAGMEKPGKRPWED